jgi:hypothetical protein
MQMGITRRKSSGKVHGIPLFPFPALPAVLLTVVSCLSSILEEVNPTSSRSNKFSLGRGRLETATDPPDPVDSGCSIVRMVSIVRST